MRCRIVLTARTPRQHLARPAAFRASSTHRSPHILYPHTLPRGGFSEIMEPSLKPIVESRPRLEIVTNGEKPASFYMRQLPPTDLVSFESKEGKILFKDALLNEGRLMRARREIITLLTTRIGLNVYFPLAQNFLTQNEPAFCGIGTLCMILNALKVDPGRVWRKPWRYAG